MSISGLNQQYTPNTLDGLTIIDTDQLYVNGQEIDITTLVPYTGANKTVDVGSNPIRTSYVPVIGNDVVNLTTLTNAVTYIDGANALTYLNKITSTPQTVAGEVSFNNTVSANYFYTDNSYNWGRQNALYNAWSIKRILNGSIIRDLQFRDETDSITTLLLSSSGQTVYVGLTCAYGTASKVPVWDANKKLVSSGTDSIKISYLDNVGSDIQTQLNARALTTYVDTQDALRLLLTGGTMSGLLQMNGNKVQSSAVPTTGNDLTNKTYVDGIVAGAGYVLKTGDTMSGALSVDAVVSVGNRLLGTPDGSPGNFWIGLRGSGTEIDRLAISIVGVPTTGVVSSVTISKPLTLPSLTADRALYLDGSKVVTASSVTGTELGYLSGATSGLQSQINARATFTYVDTADALRMVKAGGNVITGNQTFNDNTASTVAIFDGSKNLKSSTVTTTELSYVGGVTSAIQTQINTKANTTALANYLLLTGGTLSGTLLVNAYIGVNQSSPQWKIHASNTNAWTAGGYTKADGIMALGGKDNNPDYQYLIFPNPSQSDGGVAGMAWWSSDMITGRYKNEFRVAWWKEGHGVPLGNAYKEGITMFLTDSGGYTNLDYIKLNGNTTVNGKLTTTGVDTTAQINIGLASNTTPSIKFANSLNHITGNASEAYLFNGVNGYLAVGRNTVRSATEANLHMGTTGTDASVESISSDGSAYLPMTYYANKHYFYAGPVNITGNTPYAVPNDFMAKGSLTIGSTSTNYGGGTSYWSSNTAGLLFECQDKTEMAVHDAGTRVASFMFFEGSSTNTFTMGRDMGWGTTPIVMASRLQCNGDVGIGITNPTQKLTVNGNTLGYGFINAYANAPGGPSMIYSQNDTAGDGYAVMHLRNNSGSGAYWFLNSSTRAADGGGSCATLRNDIGTLRLQSSGGNGFTINATTGYTTKDGGDNSKILFGPNSTWGAYLVVGSGVTEVTANKCQVFSTNGNLHADAGLGKDIYLGYYPFASSQPNNIRMYGPLYIDNPPATTTYGSAGYGTQLGWDVLNSRVTVNVIEFYHSGPYSNYQAGYWNGVNRTNQFYKSNVSQSVWVSGYATAFISGAANMDIVIRLYNQSTGQYFYNSSIRFTNVANHHTVIPVNINFGTLPAGWYDTYTYWNQFQNADANDYISLTFMLCHGINSP